MKLSIQREAFLKPLQQIIGVVERRQTLPILGNVLLNVSRKSIRLTATDLEVELQAEVFEKQKDYLIKRWNQEIDYYH